MRVLKLEEECDSFLHHVASKKRDLKDWFFLHLKVIDTAENIKIEEVIQVLGFTFSGEETTALVMKEQREILVVSSNANKKALSIVDKSVADKFPGNAVQVTSYAMSNKGIDQLIKVVTMHESSLSETALVALKRLSRNGNVFLVLDDDLIVLKQMQKILQGFGHVEVTHDPEEFVALYKKYTPNVAFLDIHLKGARGTNVLDLTVKKIDPFAHAVMISSDALKGTVLESKHKGASGYIMKPFDRDLVYRNLLKAPTFVPYVEHV